MDPDPQKQRYQIAALAALTEEELLIRLGTELDQHAARFVGTPDDENSDQSYKGHCSPQEIREHLRYQGATLFNRLLPLAQNVLENPSDGGGRIHDALERGVLGCPPTIAVRLLSNLGISWEISLVTGMILTKRMLRADLGAVAASSKQGAELPQGPFGEQLGQPANDRACLGLEPACGQGPGNAPKSTSTLKQTLWKAHDLQPQWPQETGCENPNPANGGPRATSLGEAGVVSCNSVEESNSFGQQPVPVNSGDFKSDPGSAQGLEACDSSAGNCFWATTPHHCHHCDQPLVLPSSGQPFTTGKRQDSLVCPSCHRVTSVYSILHRCSACRTLLETPRGRAERMCACPRCGLAEEVPDDLVESVDDPTVDPQYSFVVDCPDHGCQASWAVLQKDVGRQTVCRSCFGSFSIPRFGRSLVTAAKQTGVLVDCPHCHQMIPKNARRCPVCSVGR